MSYLSILLITVAVLVGSATCGCKEIDRCCEAMQSDCRAKVFQQVAGKTKTRFCFCDEHCLVTGDCCDDFTSHCKKVDCEIGSWGPFGNCSVNCGYGYKKRERRVLVEPRNGGKACPNTYQRRYCYGNKCKFARGTIGGIATLKELAKVMPIEYSKIRDSPAYNGHNGIRKYVFNTDGKDKRYKQPTTCAVYKLVRANRKCQLNTNWRSAFKTKNEICVQCDPTAMRARKDFTCKGQGLEGRTTRWMTVGDRGCRGDWILLSERKQCSCNPKSTASFIFI